MPNPSSRDIYSRTYLLAGIATIFVAASNFLLGRSEFGGYDLSALIDSAWRLKIGQIPNIDNVCTFPPSLYLPIAAAFRLFGEHWFCILLCEDLIYLGLCFLGLRLCYILERKLGRDIRLLAWIYIAGQSIAILCINHPWHSALAAAMSAYALLVSCVLYVVDRDNKNQIELWGHLSLAIAVLLLSKPNTAWPAIFVCLIWLFVSQKSWKPLGLSLIMGTLIAAALLAVFHITFVDLWRGYRSATGRVVPRYFLLGIRPDRSSAGTMILLLTYLFLLLPMWRLLQIVRKQGWQHRRPALEFLCLGAVAISLIGMGTNWDIKIIDTVPILTGLAMAATMMPERYQRVRKPLETATVLLVLLAATIGELRVRMKMVGPWAGAAYGPQVQLYDRFFGKFETRQQFATLLAETDRVIANAHGATIFFGPRLEFLYARDNIPSPQHLPVWWHPGTSYDPGQEAQIDHAWEDHHFQVLIFPIHEKIDRFPGRLFRDIDTHYWHMPGWTTIDVYYRLD